MALMAASKTDNQEFCLREILDTFKLCVSENKEVSLEYYVAGWRGLVKFLNTLGYVFYKISEEVLDKVGILVGFLDGDNSSHYATIQSMVEYELGNQLLDLSTWENHPNSGCRTLLRLHRALRWLELFLDRLRTSSEDSNTSTMCNEAYNESLYKYHPFVVRNFAWMTFPFLPGRQVIFKTMNVGSPEQVVAVLGEVIPLITKVYQITEDLFAQHNLLDLP